MNDIKKGSMLVINSRRKGLYKAIATEDFNISDEWYKVATLEDVDGFKKSSKWQAGESIPCRKGICKIVSVTPPAGASV